MHQMIIQLDEEQQNVNIGLPPPLVFNLFPPIDLCKQHSSAKIAIYLVTKFLSNRHQHKIILEIVV